MRRLFLGLVLLVLVGSPCLAQVSLQELDGKTANLETLFARAQTKAVVLVVWCSHCGSCRSLEEELDSYRETVSPEVRVFAVAPHPADSPQRIRSFLKEKELGLPVLVDSTQAFLRLYRIDRTTTALVFDRDKKLRYFGPFKSEDQDFAKEAVKRVVRGAQVETPNRALKGCPIPTH